MQMLILLHLWNSFLNMSANIRTKKQLVSSYVIQHGAENNTSELYVQLCIILPLRLSLPDTDFSISWIPTPCSIHSFIALNIYIVILWKKKKTTNPKNPHHSRQLQNLPLAIFLWLFQHGRRTQGEDSSADLYFKEAVSEVDNWIQQISTDT